MQGASALPRTRSLRRFARSSAVPPPASERVEVLRNRLRRPPVDLAGLGGLVLQARLRGTLLIPPWSLAGGVPDPLKGRRRIHLPGPHQPDEENEEVLARAAL